MIAWLGNVLTIVVAAFVGYVICDSVNRRTIGQMVVLVSLILALTLTIQDMSLFVNSLKNLGWLRMLGR